MQRSDYVPVLAKWRWVGQLLQAADKQHPVAYAVAALCLAVCVFVIVVFGWQCWKIANGPAASAGIVRICLEAVLAISIPGYLLFELLPRLFG